MDYTKDTTLTVDLTEMNCSVSSPSSIDFGSDDYYTNLTTSTIDTITLDTYGPNVSPNVYISNTSTPYEFGNLSIGSPLWPDAGGKISLEGKNADIEVNGESLMSMIRGIQDRLNILCPDPAMEEEWHDLRAIREQYEAKLAECREKSRAWKALKQQG